MKLKALLEMLSVPGLDALALNVPELDYELVTHQAGEKHYEIVAAEIVWQNKTIYLENE